MGVARFLTNAPLVKKIRRGEMEELAVMAYSPGVILTGKLKVYRKAGTNTTYSTTPVTLTNNRVIFNVSIPGTEDFDLITRAEAWIEFGGVAATEVRTFIPDVSSRCNAVRIAWLNLLGGVDHYTFYGEKKQEVALDKTTFTRELPVPFAISDRGVNTQSIDAGEHFEISSDFETDAVMSWLSEAVTSPIVWIVGGGQCVPVDVTTKNMTIRDGSLSQMSLKYRKANNRIVQNV